MGKRTSIDEFTVQKRGGKGVKCYKITEKTGSIIGVKAVNDDHEIMMITTQGIIIQLKCNDISTYGRVTSGVKLINLNNREDITVASIAKVRDAVAQTEEALRRLEMEEGTDGEPEELFAENDSEESITEDEADESIAEDEADESTAEDEQE